MNITLIGHICKDVIHFPDGKEEKGYGGIYYSLLTLANLFEKNVKIYPVFGINSKEYSNLLENLTQYSNIDTSGIFKTDMPTNTVNLFYKDRAQRIECSQDIAQPIPFRKIKPYLDANIILINMISGLDITLDTLDEIRITVRDDKTPIYLDVHSLSLGFSPNGRRFHRPVTEWRRWLFMLHAVQMNEEEAKNLAIEETDEDYLAKQITALNTENVIITRGANGCTLYQDIHKQVNRSDFRVEDFGEVQDTTGCGDVFAAAYCAKYLFAKNAVESVKFANKVASFKSTLGSSAELSKISEFKITNSKITEKKT